jgi:outer membrane protein OmpA-like peptidoglycan-associated protein
VFEEEDRETGYAVFLTVTLAIVVSLFVIAIAIGNVVGQAGGKKAAAVPAMTAPSVVQVLGKLYFEVGKADLPVDAAILLRPAIRAARAVAGSTLVVSGYHDASGDAAANAELAKRRAMAVRDMLVAEGIGEQRIELAKPALTLGGADDAQARRVEVTLR